MKFTDKDYKEIRYEMRMGYIFSTFILAFGGLFNLVYIVVNTDNNWLLLCLIDVLIVGFSIGLYFLVNRKLIRDLKDGTKVIRLEKVLNKERQTSYEAGSGKLHIPILGDIFPKLWGQEMKPKEKFSFIINGFRYEVNEDVFQNVKESETVEMHFSNHSGTLLGIYVRHQRD